MDHVVRHGPKRMARGCTRLGQQAVATMNNAPPPPPPVPGAMPAVGTPEWADWAISTVLPPSAADAVKRCVAHGMANYGLQSSARLLYCEIVISSGWEGWVARMVWDCIAAKLKPVEDDIPF